MVRLATTMRRGAFLALSLIMLPLGLALADGSETLGPPSIAIAPGTGYIAEGVGLTLGQPGTINLTVPAGVTIKQVLLYWEGQHTTVSGDNSIVVGGNAVVGTLIGGPDYFFGTPSVYSSTYRADITGLGLVTTGLNSISVSGLSFSRANNGAGILVVIDDGSTLSELLLRDGNDLAYRFFPAPRLTTVAQTFTFIPSPVSRQADLSMFFSSVQGTVSTGGPLRPSRISVTIGAVTTNFDDVLNSNDGEEWDTYTTALTIPAGVSQVVVQAISGPGGDDDPNTPTPKPASFAWIAAGLSVPPPPGGEGCTPGYWKQPQHFDSWPAPYTPNTQFSAVFENAFPGKTLLQVLSTGGGGLIALGRHTVAALLNGQSGGVDYDLSAAQVIAMFNFVYPAPDSVLEDLKDIFAGYNEQGCPLNRVAVPDEGTATTARLYQNYPNPFNPSTEIYFQTPDAGQVTVTVYNMLGQQVKVLADGQFEAGVHSLTWDAHDQNGNAVTSGVYFYHLRAGNVSQMLKMTLMR